MQNACLTNLKRFFFKIEWKKEANAFNSLRSDVQTAVAGTSSRKPEKATGR
jgi:hypothetical protein